MTARYVLVRLLNGFAKPLLYTIPTEFQQTDLNDTIVEVPLRNKLQPALVLKTLTKKPRVTYPLRAISGVQALPTDTQYHQFVTTVARLYDTQPLTLYQRLRSFVASSLSPSPRRGSSDDDLDATIPLDTTYQPTPRAVTLTDEQQHAVDAIMPSVISPSFAPQVLHGVTGSGKTEVYVALMRTALQQRRSILFLCPEISLARRFESVLRDKLPEDTAVYGFYSGVKKSEKEALWQAVLQGKPVVVVGVHLPVLLPLTNLGLIVVDEEHESGFAEKNAPQINSKHAALIRAQQYGVPIVLGSATPSVATLYHAEQQKWPVFRLTKRFAGAFPTVEHVVLGPPHKRKHFWFSERLLQNITTTLAKGEQIILYVNRRGFSSCAQCTHCGELFSCSNCAVSMKVHMQRDAAGNDSPELRCHYCDAAQLLPPRCPQCKAPGSNLQYKGIGTQQVVTQLKKLFPQARIARADTDVSRRKKEWAHTIEQFSNHELDMLVGTQIITKGYHFPRVTMVGVLWGDSGLHFPTYNAHEVALQQLLQVAGRAGRASSGSRVIVQSFAEHDIFNFLSEERYEQFYRHEITQRTEGGYPPCGRLLQVTMKNSDERQLCQDAALLTKRLSDAAGDDVMVLGPATPVVGKIARQHVRQILLKAGSFKALYTSWEAVKRGDMPSSVSVLPS